jgi:MoaA/NifB/PqqE/SkfB family radical SAM enzyme
MPFSHFYAEPTGEMRPCCIADSFETPINLRKTKLEDAWNSEQMKALRKDMMEGKRNSACDVCYKKEDRGEESPRHQFNKLHKWLDTPNPKEDYSIDFKVQTADIRFSNLCNFQCRMCNHNFSSNWYDLTNKTIPHSMEGVDKVLKVSDTIVDDFIPQIPNLKSIYFAGGEPLIMPEHFRFLKEMQKLKKDDEKIPISIHYNTNLSVITYDENELIDIWKDFQRVFLSISCDGINDIGEYQRVGFDTKKFLLNLKKIREISKPALVSDTKNGIHYNFQYTTTIFNVMHIFEFLDFMLDNGFITKSSHIDFYYTWYPSWISLNNIPTEEKDQIIYYLKTNLSKRNLDDKTINEINNIITFIKSEKSEVSKWDGPDKIFIIDRIKFLDKYHNTDYNKLNAWVKYWFPNLEK